MYTVGGCVVLVLVVIACIRIMMSNPGTTANQITNKLVSWIDKVVK